MIIRDPDYKPLFYLSWLLIAISLLFHMYSLAYMTNLKRDNAELQQAVASMIDSQNQLVDRVDDEVQALKKIESRLGDWDGEAKK